MLKICVENNHLDDCDCGNYFESSSYDTSAEFNLPEEATTYSAVSMFYEALKLDGYFPSTILRAFKYFCDYECENLGITMEEIMGSTHITPDGESSNGIR